MIRLSFYFQEIYCRSNLTISINNVVRSEPFIAQLQQLLSADPSLRDAARTGSPVAHGGHHGRCFNGGNLRNALPPLGASLSLWEKTALAHYELS
ncbi:hypothetical protein [Tolypothrix sp. VBCCA 56010]|uniref:hypothetical protein n=1 Tax=Tolypothrix sp. VBCCA 56010 TaxID=3137731 RepID=UPI003D7DC0AD